MNHLIGTLTHAGDLDVNDDQYSGCALEIDRAILAGASLPMYRKCIILPIDGQGIADMIGAMSEDEYAEDPECFAERFNDLLKCVIDEYFSPTISGIE